MEKFKNIRNYLKKLNDNWWNVERKDLDIKYYVSTDSILETIKDYICVEYYNRIIDNSIVEDENFEKVNEGLTYNWNGKVQNDFQFETYRDVENDVFVVFIKFHLYGDIRNNYTDYIPLKFDYEDSFFEILDEIEYENSFTFKGYIITPSCLDEELNVYDVKNDCNIYGIYAINDDELNEALKIFEL